MKEYKFSGVLKSEMNDFVQLRSSRGLRDYTKLYILESLDKYLIKQNITDKELTPTVIDGWLAGQREKSHINTINNFINYYSPFARHLNILGIPAFMPERPIYQRTYKPYIFTVQEIEEIFHAADEMKGRINSGMSRLQFPMLLRLLFGCGLRLGEALRLRYNDVDAEKGVLHIFNAKGNIDRLVPMESGFTALMLKYCNALLKTGNINPFLFEREDGTARSQGWATWYWDKVLRETDIDIPKLPPHSRKICLHCFRHTFAVNSLRMNETAEIEGIDITPLLSIYLGHKHLTGTQVYLHMTAENAEDIFRITSSDAKEIFPEVPQA
jgi:integrase